MHNKPVFVAAKKSKKKIIISRSAKVCLWDINVLSVFLCLIFSKFFEKCLQPYMEGFESALKLKCWKQSHRQHICNFPKRSFLKILF